MSGAVAKRMEAEPLSKSCIYDSERFCFPTKSRLVGKNLTKSFYLPMNLA